MEINYFTKDTHHYDKRGYCCKHDYSLRVILTKEDFKGERIKEIVLKIQVPSSLNWCSTGEIMKKEERNYTTFELKKEKSLYPQETPIEILGPESDSGEILYSVTRKNHDLYFDKTKPLRWELYGDGVKEQGDIKPLEELQNF